jgi:RecA-family ATPase
MERLQGLRRRYGGEIHDGGKFAGYTLFGATVDGERVSIGIGDDGAAYTFTIKSGRKKLVEPAPLTWVNPAQWHGEPVPARQWYVPDLIPMRQVTLLYGDGGVGKSLLALQIAAAGAMSVETLGLVPWAGRVIYLGAEDEADEFHRRLADISKTLGGDLSDLHLFRLLPAADMDALLSVPDKAGTMQPTALWREFAEKAQSYNPKLIVLDTAADLYGGDEVKRGQVRQFVSMLRKLAIKVNCAVILLAHPSVQGMTSGTGTSGSTGWSNSSRSRLYLTADKEDSDLRILKTMKINYGKVGGELKLRWQDGAFVLDDGKPSPAAGMMAKRAKDVFLRLLSETNRVGSKVGPSPSATYAPKVFADRKDAGGIKKDAFTDAMNELLADGTIAIVTEGRKGRETKRLVVVADEIAQGRADGLPDHVSDPPVRPLSDPCQTLSDGWGGHPPITPSASDAASDSSDDGHAGLTASNDNELTEDQIPAFLKKERAA